MKKKKLTNFLKMGIFLLGISLLLWNCDKEEMEYPNSNEASIKHISYTDFKSKDNFSLLINKVEHKYFDRLKEVEKNEFLGKTIYSSDNTFYIQTDLIYETIKDSITNYTFKIERPQIDSLKIENLIVSLNSNTNQIKLYLLEMNESNIQNDIKFYPLDINTIDSDTLFSNKTATILGVSVYVPDCTQVSYLICGRGGNADGHAKTGGKCVGSPTILDFSNCGTGYDDDASSYGGGGIGAPIPTDNSSTSGGGTGSSSNTSNDNEFIEGAIGIIRYDATAASALKNNLLLSSAQIAWIGDSENYYEVKDIHDFLEANKDSNGEYTIESETFATEATEAYRTNGNVDFEERIILDSTFVNNPKALCVYDRLKKAGGIKQILKDFFDTQQTANLIIKLEPNLTCNSSNPFGCTSFNQSTQTATIKIDEDFITQFQWQSSGGVYQTPLLSLAKVIIHEAIHAQFFYNQYQTDSGNPASNLTFEELYENYRDIKGWQHLFMADHYLGIISNALEGVHPLLNDQTYINYINNNYPDWTWKQIYKNMAWSGLIQTPAGQTYLSNPDNATLYSLQNTNVAANSNEAQNCN